MPSIFNITEFVDNVTQYMNNGFFAYLTLLSFIIISYTIIRVFLTERVSLLQMLQHDQVEWKKLLFLIIKNSFRQLKYFWYGMIIILLSYGIVSIQISALLATSTLSWFTVYLYFMAVFFIGLLFILLWRTWALLQHHSSDFTIGKGVLGNHNLKTAWQIFCKIVHSMRGFIVLALVLLLLPWFLGKIYPVAGAVPIASQVPSTNIPHSVNETLNKSIETEALLNKDFIQSHPIIGQIQLLHILFGFIWTCIMFIVGMFTMLGAIDYWFIKVAKFIFTCVLLSMIVLVLILTGLNGQWHYGV